MILQAIALAGTSFTEFVLENLIERFIRVVLAVLIQDLQLPIADQRLVDQAREHRIIEKLILQALAPASCSFDSSAGWTLPIVPAKFETTRANERKAVRKIQRLDKLRY